MVEQTSLANYGRVADQQEAKDASMPSERPGNGMDVVVTNIALLTSEEYGEGLKVTYQYPESPDNVHVWACFSAVVRDQLKAVEGKLPLLMKLSEKPGKGGRKYLTIE